MYLCEIDEILELSTKQFEYRILDEIRAGFVVKWQSKLYAFENRCPHTGVELNWQDNIFLNFDNTAIQCATHGAQFKVLDGSCIWGPCVGQSLIAIPLKIRSNKVYIVITE